MDQKEEKSLKAKIYYQKNKEKIKERVKKRADNRKEEKQEYDKKYFAKNGEQIKQKNRNYHNKNKETISKRKEMRLLTLEGRLAKFKTNTRHMNILDGDFERYDNCTKCEICNTEFIKKKIIKCLDHDHISKYVRFICCNICNIKLGMVDRRKHILHLEFYRKIIYDQSPQLSLKAKQN